MGPDDKSSGGLIDDLKNAASFPDAQEFIYAFERISSAAREVNNLFGQSRQRINELKTEIVNSLPGIARLGGDVGTVADTIGQIASSSRRNIIANNEDVEKLYASSKVLGTSVSEISEGFLNVGVGLEQMGEQLENSVNYVRSIGGNTKQVMDSVRNNMDQMNRYQFEGGVQGLTKMAAQASMLRFDMNETFRLAEDVYKPERAIEVASAFQRLGVSAGALTDPFALMNQSINDPSGLQNSLVDVAKQFSYFDEKTKTFKINPQGVLTLKEMQDQTGINAREMSKLALAAAELDARLSEISGAGLSIASEEDKQYLANIATMKDGKYIVTLDDKTEKELAELTQPEFDKLIQQQKDSPKTMEEIAKSQLSYSERITGDVEAIRGAIVGGAVTQKDLLKVAETINKVSTTVSGEVSKNFSSPQAVRDTIGESIDTIKQLFKDVTGKEKSNTDAFSDFLASFGTQGLKIEKGLKESLIKSFEDSSKKITGGSDIEKTTKEFLDGILGMAKKDEIKGANKGSISEYSLIEGRKTDQVKDVASKTGVFGGGPSTGQIEFVSPLKVDVHFTGAAAQLGQVQQEQVTKMIANALTNTEVQQLMVNVNKPKNSFQLPRKTDLGNYSVT